MAKGGWEWNIGAGRVMAKGMGVAYGGGEERWRRGGYGIRAMGVGEERGGRNMLEECVGSKCGEVE